ncbi:hypothetical protein [Trujillonella humicola]|uniref:hypothetical protein n=1 Tax=Trujillonella humicola TaxID=3383699 RepID=UPI003905CE81
MRRRLIVAGAAGALALAGLGVAVPALADGGPATETGTAAEDRIRDALADLVEDGSLTQEQADEVATALTDAGFGGHHGGHGGPGSVRPGLSTAAETLGMTEAELREALRADDASLATVAEAQGVDVRTLVDALVAEATERIEQAVTDGHLTREEADERLADLEERITERVTSSDGPGGAGGPRDGHGHGGPSGDSDGD